MELYGSSHTFYLLSSCILSVFAYLFTILWSDSCSIKETFDFDLTLLTRAE